MYSTSVSRPTRSPTWAKTVFTELVSASVNEIGPKSSPPEFSSGTPLIVLRRGAVDDRVRRDLAGVERRRGGDHLEGRAGRVELLRGPVEERLVRGRCSSAPNCVGIRFGSYSGIDTITRTLPVCGSIATTAPLRPGEAVDGRLRARHVEVRDHVVALAVAALEPGQDRLELVLLAGQLVVAGLARARGGRS